jgi:hypothetical protein
MWKLQPSDRLDHWRKFRHRLSDMPLESALSECSCFWRGAPFTPFYLDHQSPESWPNPWDLVYENYYCDLAIALGIVYTLHLCDHGRELDLSIRIYQDPVSRHQYNLAWIDHGKYVLNFQDDEIVNRKQVPDKLKLLAEFTSQQMKLDNY